MASVTALLAEARAAGIDRLDAHLLLAHHLGQTQAWLLAHDDAPVAPEAAAALRADIARRAAGVPLAYLVGTREFYGLRFAVGPAVLVPRPETETLVDWALELCGGDGAHELIDLGTGSGAIALALKSHCRSARVTATDTSDAALACARANAEALGLEIRFAAGDWWAAAAGRHFDIALANPPYVAEGDPHLAALRHEPALALTAGRDGLDAIRVLVAGAPDHLRPGGWLLLEHGRDQRRGVAALLAAQGFADIETRTDLAGLPRCTGGRHGRLRGGAVVGAGAGG